MTINERMTILIDYVTNTNNAELMNRFINAHDAIEDYYAVKGSASDHLYSPLVETKFDEAKNSVHILNRMCREANLQEVFDLKRDIKRQVSEYLSDCSDMAY